MGRLAGLSHSRHARHTTWQRHLRPRSGLTQASPCSSKSFNWHLRRAVGSRRLQAHQAEKLSWSAKEAPPVAEAEDQLCVIIPIHVRPPTLCAARSEDPLHQLVGQAVDVGHHVVLGTLKQQLTAQLKGAPPPSLQVSSDFSAHQAGGQQARQALDKKVERLGEKGLVSPPLDWIKGGGHFVRAQGFPD